MFAYDVFAKSRPLLDSEDAADGPGCGADCPTNDRPERSGRSAARGRTFFRPAYGSLSVRSKRQRRDGECGYCKEFHFHDRSCVFSPAQNVLSSHKFHGNRRAAAAHEAKNNPSCGAVKYATRRGPLPTFLDERKPSECSELTTRMRDRSQSISRLRWRHAGAVIARLDRRSSKHCQGLLDCPVEPGDDTRAQAASVSSFVHSARSCASVPP
jgi:hypothetical protein